MYENKKEYAIENYDATDENSEDGKRKTSADVAMLRALTLKMLLEKMGANGSNIEAKVGLFNSAMRARISVR